RSARVSDRREDFVRDERRADRLITGAQPLGHYQQIGRDAFLRASPSRASAPEPTHHFIENQQDAVPVADFADAFEIAGRWRNTSGGRADDGLGDKTDHGFRADPEQRLFQFICDAQPVFFFTLVFATSAIGVAGRDVFSLSEQRQIDFAALDVPSHAQAAQRAAVITLATGDEPRPLRLANVDEIL